MTEDEPRRFALREQEPRRFALREQEPGLPRGEAQADPLLATLSPEQLLVVAAPAGPLLVLAGAGSGKTRALTHRMAYLLRQDGAGTGRVLLMTFTSTAAHEMLRRSAALLGGVEALRQRVWAGTFHQIALRVLAVYGGRIGLPQGFRVLGRQAAADLLGGCLRQGRPGMGAWPRAEALLRLLSYAINAELPLAAVLEARAPRLSERLAELQRVLADYTRRKLLLHALDFDDLLLSLRLLMVDHPDVAAQLQGAFRHVLVDEYQDVSRLQGALCAQLAEASRSLTVVGDDAQSIYRFRGAEVDHILSFPASWPGAQVLHLSANYRSSRQIVELCNRSIAFNGAHNGARRGAGQGHRRPMRAVRQEAAAPPQILHQRDPQGQAEQVVLLLSELHSAGRPYEDMAVLYRNHAHAREVERALSQAGVPYRLRARQRDLAAADPLELDLDEPAPLGRGEAAPAGGGEGGPPSSVEPAGEAMEVTLEPVIEGGGVVLSTVHQAKGLEWGVVIIIWLAEGHFPARAAPRSTAEQEERRLFYVAATRARDHLYLCAPLSGCGGGALCPSRFVTELVVRHQARSGSS